MQPTVLEGHNRMRVFQEEIFGPVLSVTRFKDDDEALAIANDFLYGLGAGVWTRNGTRATRFGRAIKAGRVWTNCYHLYPAHAAFGGYKQSGVGRENHKMMLDHYQQTKNMLVSYSPKALGLLLNRQRRARLRGARAPPSGGCSTVERVLITEAAAEVIATLRKEPGDLMFHQSGGCCDGSAPMCYPAREFRGKRGVYISAGSKGALFILVPLSSNTRSARSSPLMWCLAVAPASRWKVHWECAFSLAAASSLTRRLMHWSEPALRCAGSSVSSRPLTISRAWVGRDRVLSQIFGRDEQGPPFELNYPASK